MTIISDLHTALASAGIPVASSSYIGEALNYIVLDDLGERTDFVADNAEFSVVGEADVNLYFVGAYEAKKNSLITTLKSAGYHIADRRHVGYDKPTDQHHYVITVRKKEVL